MKLGQLVNHLLCGLGVFLTFFGHPTLVILFAVLFLPWGGRYYFRTWNEHYLIKQVFHAFIYPMNLVGHKMVFYGDYKAVDENSLVITNHSYWCDFMTAMYWARAQRPRNLAPQMKMFVKDSIGYVPGPNLALWGNGYIFVSRRWQSDKPYVAAKLRPLLTDPLPFTVMLHPEGSRTTPQKLLESQAFARENKLPVLKHLLTPRVRGFVTTCLITRPKLGAIYDFTIAYAKPPPGMVTYFLGGGQPYEAHVLITRYPVSEVPETEEELMQWLHKVYEKKDKALGTFKETGAFDAPREPYRDMSDEIRVGFFKWILTTGVWFLIVAATVWKLWPSRR